MQQMYTIYIMLTKSGTLLSNLIHVYTKTPYSHVSISLDEDLEEVYSFGRYNPYNPVWAGFIKEEIRENGTYCRFPDTKCAIYSLDINKNQYEKLLEEIERFKKEGEKYRYNMLGLLGVMFKRPINRKNKYFCSQFVSEVLTRSEIDLINKETGLVIPDDFRHCKDLELVYEGHLREKYAQ